MKKNLITILVILLCFFIYKYLFNVHLYMKIKNTEQQKNYSQAVETVKDCYSSFNTNRDKLLNKQTINCPQCHQNSLREISFIGDYALHSLIGNSDDSGLSISTIVQVCKNQKCKFFALQREISFKDDDFQKTLYSGKYDNLEDVLLENPLESNEQTQQQKENTFVILETIPKGETPNWINKNIFEENSNICIVTKNFYFNKDLNEEIKENFIKQDKERIITDFRNKIFMNFAEISLELNAYKDNNGKFLREKFLANVEKITIPEFFVDIYLEKIEESNGKAKTQYWNIFILFVLPKEKYNEKIKDVFTKTYKQVEQNPQATELLKEIENKFYGE